ncbi:hypothetical protein B0T26DRAFT_676210 [Lasiosphaeria miniovina]|uniref:Uncharacterized protein n=1 Tax=Lasiosphaeria miniovina TaxID=1954250 RepID=A0AA40DVK9_9PEZI|nr:uncharacterized protein B0T26DRAFT_676210 [Lasiosphaeria miniovina]KAK0717979.1 hypothetical protein B0T26DRAFT_676210 [Lasiosphaeria miniovina]
MADLLMDLDLAVPDAQLLLSTVLRAPPALQRGQVYAYTSEADKEFFHQAASTWALRGLLAVLGGQALGPEANAHMVTSVERLQHPKSVARRNRIKLDDEFAGRFLQDVEARSTPSDENGAARLTVTVPSTTLRLDTAERLGDVSITQLLVRLAVRAHVRRVFTPTLFMALDQSDWLLSRQQRDPHAKPLRSFSTLAGIDFADDACIPDRVPKGDEQGQHVVELYGLKLALRDVTDAPRDVTDAPSSAVMTVLVVLLSGGCNVDAIEKAE